MSTTLREFITQSFDLEELRTLSYDLGVEYDDLRGEGRAAKVRELIKLMERADRIDDLTQAVRKSRAESFESAQVIVERELIRADLESAEGTVERRWSWWQIAAPILVIVLLVVLIVQLASRPGERETTTTTPSSVSRLDTSASQTITPTSLTAALPSATPEPLTPTPPPLPSAESTPTQTAPPAPTTPVTGQPADVLIAEFDTSSATIETARVAYRLEADLQDRLRQAGLRDVTLSVISTPVTNEDQARALASERGSKVIIWGWYDRNDIQVRIFLAGEGPWRDQPATFLVPLEHESETQELSVIVEDVIEEELADDVSFLSFFVIGHLHYLANQYQAGHDAFDAAMNNLPDNATLQNRALVPFFSARQREAQGDADVADIVCEYAQAIELDPAFAEAYNNLGVVLAARYRPPTPAGGETIIVPDEAYPCLERIGFRDRLRAPQDLFAKALELQPGWLVAEFNSIAFSWLENPEVHELKARIEAIVQRDPSIAAAHVILGNIAFDADETEAAVSHFSSALALIPGSTPLHLNLGQALVRDDQEAQAETQFQAALELDPGNLEGHLALANLALRQGQTDVALHHLQSIPVTVEVESDLPSTLADAAVILTSRLQFDAGELELAIETLQTASPGSLQRYLLGLLHTLQGDPAAAEEAWSALWYAYSYELERIAATNNETAESAWYDLAARCAQSDYDDITGWGSAQNPCLPADLEARIAAVYDIFQSRLPYRLYYQPEIFVVGAACPYVYTYDAGQQAWLLDTTILYHLVGREREVLQRRPLARFDGRLLIREVEPEISYLDQLYVLIMDRAGRLTTLYPALPALQTADDRYLVLNPGDQLQLTFEGYQEIANPAQFWVVAEGFYLPLGRNPQHP